MLRLFRRIHYFVRQRRLDAELAEEIESHRAMRQRDVQARGLTAADAVRASHRCLGNVTLAREDARGQWIAPWLESVWQDVQYGSRTLRRDPAFLVVAILTLALGIGANTALFSVADAVLWRMLPVSHPEQLVFLDRHPGRVLGGYKKFSDISLPLMTALRARDPLLAGATTFVQRQAAAIVGGESEPVTALAVADDFYALLGVQPQSGRLIQAGDAAAGTVVVLGHRFWIRRFGGRDVLGTPLVINDVPHTIVGVTPREFFGLAPGEVFDVSVPMPGRDADMTSNGISDPQADPLLFVLARMKPGVDIERSAQSLTTTLRTMMRAEGFGAAAERHRIAVRSASQGFDRLRTSFSTPLLALLALAALVLLIACANLANLLLARAGARSREIGVRLSIGAGRGRIARQLTTESLMLACLGGAAGWVIATWSTAAFLRLIASGSPPLRLAAPLDGRVFLFTAAVSVVGGLSFGLVPAWQALRSTRPGTAAVAHGSPRSRPARVLVVAQVALTIVLLTGAALFVRTFRNLASLDAGFSRHDVLVVNLDTGNVRGGPPLDVLYENILERAGALPGVLSATFERNTPLGGSSSMSTLVPVGFVQPAGEPQRVTYVDAVGPAYFRTMGIRLVAGRDFSAGDRRDAPNVIAINEAAARLFFPGEHPIGRRMAWGDGAALEIVAVAADARTFGLRERARPLAYLPLFQQSGNLLQDAALHARTSGNPLAFAAAVRQIVREVATGVAVMRVTTMNEVTARSLVQERLVATLAASFGGLALLLSCVGLAGVLSFAVVRRTREIGIRMALGATRDSVAALVLRDALLMVTTGALLGVPCAMAGALAARSLLFGLSPIDAASLAAAVVLLGGAAAVASWLPARRAAHVDPLVALRHD